MTDDEVLDGIDGRVVGRSVLDEALDLHRNLADGPSGPTWRRMTALVKTIAALHPDHENTTRTCTQCHQDACTAATLCGRH